MSDQADCLPPPAMPVPVPVLVPVPVSVSVPVSVPSPRTVPAVPVPAAKRSSSSSSSSGSGSGARRGSGRRQASSPPTTASRPTSRSRYSPSTSPRTTTKGSPLADAARMPPPPPPPPAPPPQSSAPRTASLRNRRAANEAPPRRTGRTPSVSAAGGRAKTEDERLALATAASKSLGNALGVGAKPALKGSTGKAPARGRAATVDKAPDASFGKAMSLRSRTAGKTESTATATATGATATTTTRARAGTGAKRGANTVGATSKQDPSMAAALSGVRRPSTTSLVGTTTTSMPPPPPAAKGHRRSASGVNATTPPTPTTTTTTTTTTTAAAISTTTTTTATAVPSINANPRPTATAGSTKTKRPAFSALTQDFTVPPNPNPPPSPRSRIVPPPPLDTSTLHAQTQLLQLLTLRSSSAAVYQQLIASATATLKSRFEKLSARHYDARETSAKKQKRHNIDSLAAVVTNVGVVGGSVGGRKRRETTVKSPEERVQAFSEAIKRIDAMRSGEFRVLCTAFGEWIAGYNPRGGGSGSGGRERWIDGIGESWRRECVGVCRRLEVGIVGVDGVAGVLAEHGEVEALVTTVSRVAEGYRELAEGMLEEVEMMGRMENEVVERERMEMGRRVKAILEGGEMEHVYSGQGIWAAG